MAQSQTVELWHRCLRAERAQQIRHNAGRVGDVIQPRDQPHAGRLLQGGVERGRDVAIVQHVIHVQEIVIGQRQQTVEAGVICPGREDGAGLNDDNVLRRAMCFNVAGHAMPVFGGIGRIGEQVQVGAQDNDDEEQATHTEPDMGKEARVPIAQRPRHPPPYRQRQHRQRSQKRSVAAAPFRQIAENQRHRAHGEHVQQGIQSRVGATASEQQCRKRRQQEDAADSHLRRRRPIIGNRHPCEGNAQEFGDGEMSGPVGGVDVETTQRANDPGEKQRASSDRRRNHSTEPGARGGTGLAQERDEREESLPGKPKGGERQRSKRAEQCAAPKPGPAAACAGVAGVQRFQQRHTGEQRPGDERAVHARLSRRPEQGRGERTEQERPGRGGALSRQTVGNARQRREGKQPKKRRGEAQREFARSGEGLPHTEQQIGQRRDQLAHAQRQHLAQRQPCDPPQIRLVVPQARPAEVPDAQGKRRQQQ